ATSISSALSDLDAGGSPAARVRVFVPLTSTTPTGEFRSPPVYDHRMKAYRRSPPIRGFRRSPIAIVHKWTGNRPGPSAARTVVRRPRARTYAGRMDFRQLRYFTAVGQLKSFSQAAERCFISQSAISHQIAQLEQHLGVKLFDRSTRNVELTAAGERLMPVASEALSIEHRVRDVVRERRNRIRITANMSFAAQ